MASDATIDTSVWVYRVVVVMADVQSDLLTVEMRAGMAIRAKRDAFDAGSRFEPLREVSRERRCSTADDGCPAGGVRQPPCLVDDAQRVVEPTVWSAKRVLPGVGRRDGGHAYAAS
jgi:hypothetical protein